jgi:hypothetical protein
MRRTSVIAAASISLIASSVIKMTSTSSRGAFILFEGVHCAMMIIYKPTLIYINLVMHVYAFTYMLK